MTKREKAYYAQRKKEGDDWRAIKAKALAACDAIDDLDQLADAARDYLIADADLYKFEHGYRNPEIIARLGRCANSEAYRRAWALRALANRIFKEAERLHDMTPAERATYEARIDADTERLRRTIDAMVQRLA